MYKNTKKMYLQYTVLVQRVVGLHVADHFVPYTAATLGRKSKCMRVFFAALVPL